LSYKQKRIESYGQGDIKIPAKRFTPGTRKFGKQKLTDPIILTEEPPNSSALRSILKALRKNSIPYEVSTISGQYGVPKMTYIVIDRSDSPTARRLVWEAPRGLA